MRAHIYIYIYIYMRACVCVLASVYVCVPGCACLRACARICVCPYTTSGKIIPSNTEYSVLCNFSHDLYRK